MNRKKILGFAVGPIGSALLGVISVPVIAWYFSTEDIGRMSMLQVSCDFMVIMFGLGLDRAYLREYHETATDKKPGLLITAAAPGFILLIVTILVCEIFKPAMFASFLFSIESPLISRLVMACLVAAFLSRFLSLVLRMQEKGLAFSMSQVLPKILLLSVVGFYVFLTKDWMFEKLMIAHTVSLVTVMLIFTWNTRAVWFPGLSSGINHQKLRSMLGFGLPLAFASLASWALMAMDKLFLKSLSNYEELGVYSVAMSVAACAGIVSSIFTTIWAPTVYKWVAEGINFNMIDKISEHVLAAVTAILIICGLFSWLLAFMLPVQYDNVQFLVAACMSSILFYTLSETNAVGIGIARKSSYSLIAAILAALINGIGNYILVPNFGAVGASVSSAIAFWVFLVMRTEFARLVWRPLPRLKLYLWTFVLLTFVVGFAVSGEQYPNNWLAVWVSAGFCWLYSFRNSLFGLLAEVKILK
jgi:O-antigen/teichoic acid export membrane protein